jgi:predicted permease
MVIIFQQCYQQCSQQFYNLKQAWLALKNKPSFVTTVVLTIGLSLGALLCVLTLAYVMLIKPLPYPEQDKLVRVDSILTNSENEPMAPAFTYPGLIHLYENQKVFSKSTLVAYYAEVITSLAAQPRVAISSVTPEWFDLFAANMHLGRKFEQTEMINAYNPVAIISFKTWQDEYASAPDILTKKMTITGTSFQIIGVLAKNFIEPKLAASQLKTQVFIPWDYNRAGKSGRESWFYIDDQRLFIGKLASLKTPTQLDETLTSLSNDIWQEKIAGVDFFKGWNLAIKTTALKSVIIGDAQQSVLLLLCATIGLVIIACSNISNLFMSHIATKLRQLTIHAVLGATKKDLFKSLLIESSLLMLLSVSVALVIAVVGFEVLNVYLSDILPRVNELSLTIPTIIVAICLAGILAYFFAFVAYRLVNYRALNSQLQAGGKGAGYQVSKRLRQVLIFSQITVVTLLVFINIMLFEQSYQAINSDLGFKIDDIYRLELSFSPAGKSKSEEELLSSAQSIEQALLSLAEVKSVSRSDFAFSNPIGSAQVNAETNERFVVGTQYIDQHYFKMIKQTLIEGEFFSSAQIKDNSKVVIVNDVYAKKLSQGSALGTKIIFTQGEAPFSVIGVVKAVKLPNSSTTFMRIYRPTDVGSRGNMMVQFNSGQHLTREQIVEVLAKASNDFIVYSYSPLTKLKSKILFTQYTTAFTSAILTLLSLFLSAIGLYGILNYSTQMRRFEIGTRMAIGATRRDLLNLMISDNAKALLIGFVVSLLLFIMVNIVFNEQLSAYVTWQLLPISLMTLSLVLLISFIACYLPLRQYINQPALYSLKVGS